MAEPELGKELRADAEQLRDARVLTRVVRGEAPWAPDDLDPKRR